METAPLIDSFAKQFAPMRRGRGRQLFATGRARVVEPGMEEIAGIVSDSARGREVEHHVYLLFLDDFDGEGLDVSCDCRGPEFCEHGYALLLAEQERRLGLGGRRRARVTATAPTDTLDGSLVRRPASTPPPTGPAATAAAPGTAPTHATSPPSTPPPAAATQPDWRKRLRDAGDDQDDVLPPPRDQRQPLYFIGVLASRKGGRLRVHTMLPSKPKKGGAKGTNGAQDANGTNDAAFARPIHPTTNPRAFPEIDQTLLKLLATASHDSSLDYFDRLPAGEHTVDKNWAPTIVPMLFATGRVFHMLAPGQAPAQPFTLDSGEPFTFRTRLERTPGTTRIHGVLQRGDEVLAHGDVNAVVDGGFALLHTKMIRVRCGRATSLARTLLQDGPLTTTTADERALLGTLLEMTHGDPEIAPPVPTRKAAAPTPQFVVHMDKAGKNHALGELQFLYGACTVELEGTALLPEPDGETWLLRDVVAEGKLGLRVLELLGRDAEPTGTDGCVTIANKKLGAVLTRIVEAGIRVLADGKPILRYQTFSVSVKTGVDWFDLDGAIDFGNGSSLPLGKALLAAKRGERFVVLGDGKTGVLPDEWLARWGPLLELGEANGDGVRLRSSQAMLIDALLAAKGPAEITTDQGYKSLKKRLAAFSGIAPRQEPAGFRGELRPYQRLGLAWLHFLRDLRLGGCLADDMGLGKTVQVLALLQHVHANRSTRPSLLVVPRSLLDNWRREAARFTPELRVAMFTNATRWERLPPARLAEHDLVITTYGTLRADAVRFEQDQITWEHVILDEAQAIENPHSVTSGAVRLVRAQHRLALTGTPVQNHLGELWALFEFLTPGLLGRSAVFQALTAGRKRQAPGLDGKLLQQVLAPFLLRRTKEQVLPELPAKQEQLLACELEGSQRTTYDALRAHYRSELRGAGALDNRERFLALEALLRLRQAACHEALIDKNLTARPSAKLDALLPMLQEIAASGHKALVFSQFTGFLAIVRARLQDLGLDHEYLDGKTRDRQLRVDRFQGDPGCALFLISLKAGGFGLNLTAADYVFLLDPWWNPAAESQAIDRAHRIGQQRKVVAYRLVAADTVEEKVLALQAEKRALVESVLGQDGGSLLAGISRDDLLALIG